MANPSLAQHAASPDSCTCSSGPNIKSDNDGLDFCLQLLKIHSCLSEGHAEGRWCPQTTPISAVASLQAIKACTMPVKSWKQQTHIHNATVDSSRSMHFRCFSMYRRATAKGTVLAAMRNASNAQHSSKQEWCTCRHVTWSDDLPSGSTKSHYCDCCS